MPLKSVDCWKPARQNISDASVEAISVETRFDAAYKAIIPSVTLLTLERAAKALGKRITVELAA
jgi:hypothetical protein